MVVIRNVTCIEVEEVVDVMIVVVLEDVGENENEGEENEME